MTTELFTNPYVQDILAQPQAVRDTLAGLPDGRILEPFAQRLASGDLRRVVLTGMGSSYFAVIPLMLTLIERGLTAQMMETSELIHFAPALLEPQTLLIVVSQSGRSAEILQLLEMVDGRSPIIGITNSLDNPLAEEANAAIVTRAGEEKSVSCKTYLAALAALAWLGDVFTEQPPDKTLAALTAVSDHITAYLEKLPTHVATLIEQLSGIRNLVYAGRGPALAAVCTAALISKESAHFPAEGMSSAAFRHGPIEMTGPDMYLLMIEGEGETAVLNNTLVNDVRAADGRVGIITQSANLDVFALPHVSPAARPLLEILPAQMMTLALAKLRGHEAGQFTLAQKITVVA